MKHLVISTQHSTNKHITRFLSDVISDSSNEHEYISTCSYSMYIEERDKAPAYDTLYLLIDSPAAIVEAGRLILEANSGHIESIHILGYHKTHTEEDLETFYTISNKYSNINLALFKHNHPDDVTAAQILKYLCLNIINYLKPVRYISKAGTIDELPELVDLGCEAIAGIDVSSYPIDYILYIRLTYISKTLYYSFRKNKLSKINLVTDGLSTLRTDTSPTVSNIQNLLKAFIEDCLMEEVACKEGYFVLKQENVYRVLNKFCSVEPSLGILVAGDTSGVLIGSEYVRGEMSKVFYTLPHPTYPT